MIRPDRSEAYGAIQPHQIPTESVKAAWQAMMAPDALAMHRAIAAALNAWPGMGWDDRSDHPRFYDCYIFILPIPEGDA